MCVFISYVATRLSASVCPPAHRVVTDDVIGESLKMKDLFFFLSSSVSPLDLICINTISLQYLCGPSNGPSVMF